MYKMYNNQQKARKTLGVRYNTGQTSRTGQGTCLRDFETSTVVRHLHPPTKFITMDSDYPPGRHSLTGNGVGDFKMLIFINHTNMRICIHAYYKLITDIKISASNK